MPNLEHRAVTARPELRAAGEGASGKTAVGYAALFNSPADIGGAWVETIAPGAFTQTLRENDVVALVDHKMGRIIGRKSAGTLRLSEDAKGLAVEIDLPDTGDGRDLAVLLERGDIGGMSFGFNVTHDEWDETVTPPKRTIHALDLIEVSAVAFPAYEDTTLGLRSLAEARKEAGRRNSDAATRRIAHRKAELEMKLRGISPAAE